MSPEEFYESSQDPFGVSNNKAEWQKAEAITALLLDFAPSSVIDIGCGEGIFTNHYLNKLNIAEFYACDI